ncbi:MAG: RDD family protein [Terracidiphilus sp.]
MLLSKMKSKYFRWVFLAALTPIAILGFVGGEPTHLGASIEISDDGYRFAGGTDPWALVYAALVILLYICLLRSEPGEQGEPMPGVLRRFVAFWIDFALGMIAIIPIIGLLPATMEWKRTGVFVWNFERTIPAPGDGLLAGTGALLGFAGLVFFYAWPLMRLLPTPGSCIMGYRIVGDEGSAVTVRSRLLRVLLGFIATSAWPIAPFISRDKRRGKFWLDKVFKTQAVKLS